MESGREHNSLL